VACCSTTLRSLRRSGWGALEPWDKDDVSVFVETQSCILKAIHKCVDCDSDEEWLRNVVRDFMTPFTRSLEERGSGMPITDPGWREFFRRLDAREIPATTLGAENGMLYDTLLRSFCGDAPIRMYFVRQLEIAQQMAHNHINSDLTRGLLRNGIGNDRVWRCVGDAVARCQSELLEGHPDLEWLGERAAELHRDYNVQYLRDSMRNRVRQRLRDEFILAPKHCGRAPCRQA
jgi:hypothetical protein